MELFSGLEAYGFARSDADLGPGAGIPADAGFPRTDIEHTKAAQLDALAFGEGALEGLKYGIHSGLSLVPLQAGAFDHLVNDVLFYQGFPPSGEVSVSRLIVETFAGIVNAARLS
jgi:hypothetical protein